MTKSLRSHYFKKFIRTYNNDLFKFVRKMLQVSTLDSSVYRLRAKILIPFIQQIMPNQIKNLSKPQEKTQKLQVDCFSNPGDCVKFIVGAKFPAFRYEYSPCTEGHDTWKEETSNLALNHDIVEDKEKLSFYFSNSVRITENVECSLFKNDGRACQGRRTKNLSEMGENLTQII